MKQATTYRVTRAHHCIGRAASCGITNLHVLRDDGGNTNGRAAYVDDFRVQTVLFVKARIVLHSPDRVQCLGAVAIRIFS
jgi:hypothetical protein